MFGLDVSLKALMKHEGHVPPFSFTKKKIGRVHFPLFHRCNIPFLHPLSNFKEWTQTPGPNMAQHRHDGTLKPLKARTWGHVYRGYCLLGFIWRGKNNMVFWNCARNISHILPVIEVTVIFWLDIASMETTEHEPLTLLWIGRPSTHDHKDTISSLGDENDKEEVIFDSA